MLGNRLPDPATLFLLLSVAVVLLSMVLAGLSEEMVQRDGSVATKTVQSLLSRDGVRWMFEHMIPNFTGFAPLGSVLTVMLGIGIAERSGLIATSLQILVRSVPNSMITAALVFAGVMSSMAADAGYVVLTPLGAVLFAGIGRHPLAGLAAAFAGVSGGFSANLLITGLDPLLAGLSTEAARTVDPEYTVLATSNWYFMVVSTFLITAVGTLVTTRIVEPMLGPWDRSFAQEDDGSSDTEGIGALERKGFRRAMAVGAVVAAGMAALALVDGSPLRDEIPEGAPAVDALAPFFESIEILIATLFAIPGIVYGVTLGRIRNDKDAAQMMTDTMATMGAYLVLAFAAAQFVAFFNWSNLGAITAVRGARMLEALGLEGFLLMLAFIVVSAAMNLVMGSASAKWAFMAPIFVPMLMVMGFSPEATQAGYRVGDSITNIITPLMPYLPIIIIFAQRYDRRMGLGTLMAAMLPYSVAFAIGWTILLGIWFGLDIPLGPGVRTTWTPG